MSDEKQRKHRVDLTEVYPQLEELHAFSEIPIPKLAEMAVGHGLGPLGAVLGRAFGVPVSGAPAELSSPPAPSNGGAPLRASRQS